MTQIFGVVTMQHVFHVSDRLLSQNTVSGTVPFDRNSNKTIIFRATDALAVVSYTGRAYLNHIPTDTFIAQSLLGHPLSDAGGIILLGRLTSWTDIGRSVERLRQDLNETFRSLPEEQRINDFQVSVLGWRHKRSRNRGITPVIWELKRPLGELNAEFKIHRYQRWWNWNKAFVLSMIPEVSHSIVDWMRFQIRTHGGKSPDEIKRILVEGIRRCAEECPSTVGYSCLQVHLTPIGSPQARIRYFSDVRQPNVFPEKVYGYSPWIVAPSVVAIAPAVIQSSTENAGLVYGGTGFTCIYEGPIRTQGSKGFFSHSSQKRPRDPQKR